MFLGSGVQNNANTPAINSQALTANLPPPGYPNRWVLDEQAGILYIDTGTALVAVLFSAGLGVYVPYTGATSNVDLGVHTLSTNTLFVTGGGGSGTGYINIPNSLIGPIATPTAGSLNLFNNGGSAIAWKNSAGGRTSITSSNDANQHLFTLPVIASGVFAMVADLAAFVPYIGATQPVTLGAQPISAQSGTFSGLVQSVTGFVGGDNANTGQISLFSSGNLQNIIAQVGAALARSYTLRYTGNNENLAYLSDLSAFMVNPMTTLFDMIFADVGGAPLRLPIGTLYQVLACDNGGSIQPGWVDASVTIFKNRITGQSSPGGSTTSHSFTTTTVGGINLLSITAAVFVTSVTGTMSFSLNATFINPAGISETIAILVTPNITTNNTTVPQLAPRMVMAKTGTVTISITATGTGTYDWYPFFQVIG